MEKIYFNENVKELIHGGDYNPDQWRDYPEILDEDMRLMQLAKVNSATIGIFSWDMLEPQEGVYDFTFTDQMIERLSKIGSKIVLATPSGSRPRWLAEKYPEVLRMDRQGHRDYFKLRHNHCFTSPVYRQKVRQINEKLSERYGRNPNVVLWHISNEFSGECHCPLCHEAFRNYLKEKFNGDLNKLNHEWWTKFWSHTYTSWDQIEPGDGAVHGLQLEWQRFVMHQTADFIDNEAMALKKYAPDIPVTTNLMPVFALDSYEFAKHLDVASWDNYPRWHTPGEQTNVAVESAFWHDYFRSIKQKPYLLMECTPSHTNWQQYNKLKRPGMHKLSSLQAIAHGSDSVQYFQWRKSRGSCEKMHGAVVDHVGNENTRVFKEVADLGETMQKLSNVTGTGVVSEVAILVDFSNVLALKQCQSYSNVDKKFEETVYKIYKAFWNLGINVDIVFPDSDFSKYKLIAAPMMYMMSEELIKKTADYVKAGGTLLSGYITGIVNENDLCYLGGVPAKELKDVFGIWAEETDTLFPGETNTVVTNDGKEYTAVDYCEIVHPKTAEVLAIYKEDFYKCYPAVCKNSYGNGTAYYVAFRDKGDYTNALCEQITTKLNIKRNAYGLTDGVTAHSREAGNDEFLFLENYNGNETTVTVESGYIDAENGEAVGEKVYLDAYGCKVLYKCKD